MHYLDGRDMVRYSKLFTEDGLVFSEMGKWQGRDAMVHMFDPKPVPAGQPPKAPVPNMIHNVTDVVIQVNGNEARAWGKFYAFFPGHDKERASVSGLGGYNDWLVKVNGQWYFKKREILHENPKIEF
jgi:hypothetical protein